jgi:Spy/CpxP family protein refolding chaperone
MSGFAGNSTSPFDAGNRRMSPNSPSPIRVEPQLGPPSRWWDDKKVIKYLGLRNDQQRRMDDIFEANRQNLSNLYGNLQREETRLVSLPPGDLQDEAKVFAAIDRVSQARSELEKAHAHILLQIRQQMDPQQLATLDHDMASLR